MNLHPVLVHHIFGALIGAFALALLLHEIDVLRGRWGDYLPASALLIGGGMLFFDPWLFHGGDFGAEGHQHVWQGLFAAVAGALEGYRVRRHPDHMLLRLVIPIVLAGLGIGFLWHEQHHSSDMLLQTVQHRIMGVTLLIAALVKLAASMRWREGQWSRAGWALMLAAFAVQLLLYVEAGGNSGH